VKQRTLTFSLIEPLLTITQIAAILGPGCMKVYDFIERYVLPTIKLRTPGRIPRQSLEVLFEERIAYTDPGLEDRLDPLARQECESRFRPCKKRRKPQCRGCHRKFSSLSPLICTT